jgi:hypothetical protein
VWVQDLPSGTVAATGRAHRDRVAGLAFSSRELLLSASWDGTVVLSRIADGNLAVLASIPFGGPVEAMLLAPDGVTLGVLPAGCSAIRLIRLDVLDAEFARLGLGVGVPRARDVPPLRPPAVGEPDRSGWPVHALAREVFDSVFYDGRVAIDPDTSLSHDWATGSPHPSAPADYFSVRWSGYLVAPAGRYRFRIEADDQGSVWIDDTCAARDWWEHDRRSSPEEPPIDLTSRPYHLRVDFIEFGGNARMRVQWAREPADGKSPPKWEDIPAGVLFHREQDALAASARQ